MMAWLHGDALNLLRQHVAERARLMLDNMPTGRKLTLLRQTKKTIAQEAKPTRKTVLTYRHPTQNTPTNFTLKDTERKQV